MNQNQAFVRTTLSFQFQISDHQTSIKINSSVISYIHSIGEVLAQDKFEHFHKVVWMWSVRSHVTALGTCVRVEDIIAYF